MKKKTVSIRGMFGSKHIPIDFCLDISGNYSLVLNVLDYSMENSSTLEISNKDDLYLGLRGNISSDYFYLIENNEIIKIKTTFLYIEPSITNVSLPLPIDLSTACISLSRSPTSLLQQLYSFNLISKKIASFSKSNLYLGLIDPEVDQSLLYKCPLISYKNQWGCQITGIAFKKNSQFSIITKYLRNILKFTYEINLNHIAYFSTMTNDILFPYEYQAIFLENYFTPTSFKRQCKIYNESEGRQGIICKIRSIKNFPSISFIFNNSFRVELLAKEVFSKIPMRRTRRMFRIKFIKTLNKIIFGLGFVQKYNLVLNEDQNYIGLSKAKGGPMIINDKYSDVNDDTGRYYYRICIYLIIGILSIGIISLVYIRKIKLHKLDNKQFKF